jgi:hypothetical protein
VTELPLAEIAAAVTAHSWSPQNLVAVASAPPEPPTIGGLLYPGKRTLLSGETESLKTWAALVLAKAETDASHTVAWADLDAMGAAELLSRLRALGVSDDVIAEQFLYFEPSERLVGDLLTDVLDEIREHRVRLFVIDAFNPMLSLHGLDPNNTSDVETFWRETATPITETGAAPVLIDHVVKNSESRGKYAIGSERKASGAIVHIGFKIVQPFSRGGTGKTVLTTHKDRPGFLPRPSIGTLTLDSDSDRITYRLEADRAHVGGSFRPTRLMEKISDYIASRDEPPSKNDVEKSVSGNNDGKRTAVNALITEGYVMQIDGPRGSKLLVSISPYSESDDDVARVPTSPNDLAQTPPPTLVSSPSATSPPRPSPKRGEDENEHDLAQPSSPALTDNERAFLDECESLVAEGRARWCE